MSKAAGYIRVSTPNQAKEGESLKTQREAIESYCKLKDIELLEIYADEGISGATSKGRPELMRIMKDAKAKKYEYLIIQRLSRFGRNARDLLNNVAELDECGVKLISLKEDMDFDSYYGKALFTMLAAVAQLEKDIIEEQMKENKYAKWKNKEIFIGRPPYGYCWNKVNKILEIIDNEAELYRQIVSMYVNKGMSCKDIAIKLRGEGIKGRKSYFSSSVISYMLSNPVYYGHYYVNQYLYIDGKRTKQFKPADEFISFETPGIISKPQWDRVQERLHFNKVKGKRISASEAYWLRDLLECGECGGKIKPHHGSVRKDKTFPRYYACYWSNTSSKDLKSHGKGRCYLIHIKADEIEEEVWFQLIGKLSMGTAIKDGKRVHINLRSLFSEDNHKKKIIELENQLLNQKNNLKSKKLSQNRLLDETESDKSSPKIIFERLKRLDREIIEIESIIDDTQDKLKELLDFMQNSQQLEEFATSNADKLYELQLSLYNLSPKDKKLFIESLVPGKIRVWNGEPEETGPWQIKGFRVVFNRAIFDHLALEKKTLQINSKWFARCCPRGASKRPWRPPRSTASWAA